jgi:hypothetical protein
LRIVGCVAGDVDSLVHAAPGFWRWRIMPRSMMRIAQM